MKIACVCWQMVGQIGGIATHLNTLRTAAIRYGDTFDILFSGPTRTKKPGLFPERTRIKGKDNWIWCDGLLPHHPSNVKDSLAFLEKNYNAVVFGYPCPNETKAYPTPLFLPVYDVKLPKLMWVMDGYWETYSGWADPLLSKVSAVLCPLESYAIPVRRVLPPSIPLVVSAFPFQPLHGAVEPKSEVPLLVWPNQWKGIKGIKQFVPQLPGISSEGVRVEMYSCGIEYYQLRKTEGWRVGVGRDEFGGVHGEGEAAYFGNVELVEINRAMQRAWFTVNLQGMTSRKETYRKGSYNNTEVEALWYGACPVLHSSTRQTDLPHDVYLTVDRAEEIPGVLRTALESGFALCPERRSKAREFARSKHLASLRYLDLRGLLP